MIDDAAPERPKRRLRRLVDHTHAPVSRGRWASGVLVMLAAGLVVSSWIDNSIGDLHWSASPEHYLVLWLAGFVTGWIVPRREAVLLCLLPVLTAIPFGIVDGGGGFYGNPNRVVTIVAVYAALCVVFIGAGIVAAGIFQSRRGSRAATAPS